MVDSHITVNGIPLPYHLEEVHNKKLASEAKEELQSTLAEMNKAKLIKKQGTKNWQTQKGLVYERILTKEEVQTMNQKQRAEQILLKSYLPPFTRSEELIKRTAILLETIATAVSQDGFFSPTKHLNPEIINRAMAPFSKGAYHKTIFYQDLKKLEKWEYIHTEGKGKKKVIYLGKKTPLERDPSPSQTPPMPLVSPPASEAVNIPISIEGSEHTILLKLVIQVSVVTTEG